MTSLLDLIDRIETRGTACFFISPHLDDAVLSAGALMAELARRTRVSLVSVFTCPDAGPQTRLAKTFVRRCGYADPFELYRRRVSEDKAACQAAGVTCLHLGLIDGAWRKRPAGRWLSTAARVVPEAIHVHPVTLIHQRLGQADRALQERLEQRLQDLFAQAPECIVFSPYGLGGHVDHVVTSRACRARTSRLVQWLDFPYLIQSRTHRAITVPEGWVTDSWEEGLEEKRRLVAFYESQVKPLFGSGCIPDVAERFLLPAALLRPAGLAPTVR